MCLCGVCVWIARVLEVPENSSAYDQIIADPEVSRLILCIIQEITKELAMVPESLQAKNSKA